MAAEGVPVAGSAATGWVYMKTLKVAQDAARSEAEADLEPSRPCVRAAGLGKDATACSCDRVFAGTLALNEA